MKRNCIAIILYALIGFLILQSLWSEGFLLMLDMVFGPWYSVDRALAQGIGSQLPLRLMIAAAHQWFGLSMDIIQKVLLYTVLVVPGCSMYRLMRELLEVAVHASQVQKSRGMFVASMTTYLHPYAFVSGLVYMLNPWMYERWISGQWLVVLGYGLLPILVLVFDRMLRVIARSTWNGYSWRVVVVFMLVFGLYPLASQHWAYIGAWVIGVYAFVSVVVCRRFRTIRVLGRLAAVFVASLAVTYLLNWFWLIDFFEPQMTYAAISWSDFAVYQTLSNKAVGIFGTVISLYGFWSQAYLTPQHIYDYWWIGTIILVAFSVIGGMGAWRQSKQLVLAVIVLIGIATVLGVGYSHPVTQSITKWLYEHVPGFSGLRETGKVIGVIAFGYAVLFGYATRWMVGYMQTHMHSYAGSVTWLACAMVPIVMVQPMFFGYSGQLHPSAYPADWYAVQARLSESNDRALFVPWRGYLLADFAGTQRISNPARAFFGSDVIVATTIDNSYIDDQLSPWDQVVFRLVHNVQSFSELRRVFVQTDVRYIIVAKEADWERYVRALDDDSLERVYAGDAMLLYKVE